MDLGFLVVYMVTTEINCVDPSIYRANTHRPTNTLSFIVGGYLE